MRVTTKHGLLLVVLLVALAIGVDTVSASPSVGPLVDCYMSPGGSFEICL